MDQEQKVADRRIEAFDKSAYAQRVKPVCTVHRRLRNDMCHEYMHYCRPMTLSDMYTTNPKPMNVTTRLRVTNKTYEYHVSGIGWMSSRAYKQFKKRLIDERW